MMRQKQAKETPVVSVLMYIAAVELGGKITNQKKRGHPKFSIFYWGGLGCPFSSLNLTPNQDSFGICVFCVFFTQMCAFVYFDLCILCFRE